MITAAIESRNEATPESPMMVQRKSWKPTLRSFIYLFVLLHIIYLSRREMGKEKTNNCIISSSITDARLDPDHATIAISYEMS